jgi:hypothetical protein
MEAKLSAFLTSVLGGGECQLHVPVVLPNGSSPLYTFDTRLNGARAGLDVVGRKTIPFPVGNRIPVLIHTGHMVEQHP